MRTANHRRESVIAHSSLPLEYPMKAYLIDPESRSVEPIEISGMSEIEALIGFNTLESDSVGTRGDLLFFDEECFIRGSHHRFRIDKLVPVAGKGVVIGAPNPEGGFRNVDTDIDELKHRIVYL